MADVAHVEIRRSASRDLVRLWLGIGSVVVGAALTGMWLENEDVVALLVAAVAAGAVGTAVVGSVLFRAVDRSVRITLTGDGMYLYRRRRPLRWADIRGVRLLTTKTKLGGLHPVLHLVVESRGMLRTYHVNLMDLDHSPGRITQLVQERVGRARPAPLPLPLPLPLPPAQDPTSGTGTTSALAVHRAPSA